MSDSFKNSFYYWKTKISCTKKEKTYYQEMSKYALNTYTHYNKEVDQKVWIQQVFIE